MRYALALVLPLMLLASDVGAFPPGWLKAPYKPVFSASFSTAACVPTTSAIGSKGEVLTFARAGSDACGASGSCNTNEMCVEANGARFEALTYANLIAYSEQIDQWLLSNATIAAPVVTPNAGVAPDGQTTAERVDFPSRAGAGSSIVYRQIAGAATAGARTCSCQIKAVSAGSCPNFCLDSFGAPTNYSNTCVTNVSDTVWTRVTNTNANVSTTGNLRLGLDGSSGQPGTVAACSVYVSQCQCNPGTWVGSYVASTTATVTSSDVASTTIAAPPNPWCIVVRAQPFSGANWRLSVVRGVAAGGLTAAAANSWQLYTPTTATVVGEGGSVFATYDGSGTLKKNTWASSTVAGVHEFAACYNAGTVTIYQDGIQQYNATSGTGTGLASVPTAIRIGDTDGTKQFQGDISAVRICNPNKRGCITPTTATKRVLALGDSITWGQSVAQPFGDLLQGTLGAGWTVQNGGIAGDTVSQAATRWAWYKANLHIGTGDYVIVMLGVNDIKNGTSAATAWTAASALFDDIRATGATLIPVTITPFKGWPTWDAAHETQRQTYNTSIKDYGTTYSLNVLDVGAAWDDGTGAYSTTACGGGTCDSGDHLHCSQAADTDWASRAAAVIPH